MNEEKFEEKQSGIKSFNHRSIWKQKKCCQYDN